MKKARENWIDQIKILACILVALEHFFQSMCTAGILDAGLVYQWFNRTIYYFHVPLFFICSGYVYQKYSKVNSSIEWGKNALKKLIALGVPYFVFSVITWVMKIVFSGDVNSNVHSLAYDLLVHPMSPYWYLFSIFFIFLITPTFTNKKNCCLTLVLAFLLKILSEMLDYYALKIIIGNQIWFVVGMSVCYFDFTETAKKYKLWAYILAGAFLFLSIWELEHLSFLMGLLACGAILILFVNVCDIPSTLAEYTMPIFLMHTIFAAGVRVVLLKIGIDTPIIHIIMGLGASFIGPIIAAELMKKLKLDILYQPSKYIRIKK